MDFQVPNKDMAVSDNGQLMPSMKTKASKLCPTRHYSEDGLNPCTLISSVFRKIWN